MSETPITRAELEREITHLRELLTERDKALQLQAAEYERRLDGLNHEHERSARQWSQAVSIERYEADERHRKTRLMMWGIAILGLLGTFVAPLLFSIFLRH